MTNQKRKLKNMLRFYKIYKICYYDGVKVGRNDNGDVIVIFSKEIPVVFEICCFSLPIKENKKLLKYFKKLVRV